MAHLSLAGVSDDGKRLLLVDDRGVEHTLDVTPDLRAALRGDASRLGQLEITMTSALRPRDIQSRIRAGESAEAVAQAARTSVEAIMAYVGPVLAEREHVAERARRSHVRRPAGGDSTAGARVLGDAVDARLRGVEADPETVAWDAWRRNDGRWTLVGEFDVPVRSGTAHFTYDARGNFVVTDDDDARWLVGDAISPAPELRDDLEGLRQRRLSVATDPDELPLGEDAIGLVHPEPHAPARPDAPAPAPGSAPLEDPDEPLPAAHADEPAASATSSGPDEPAGRVEPDEAADEVDDAEQSPAGGHEEPARRPVQKRRGRASVPSWDEIMFGGPSEADRA